MRKILNLTHFSTLIQSSPLKKQLAELVPLKQSQIKDIRKKYGNETVGTLTINDLMNGLKDFPALFYESSIIDQKMGILTKGYSLQELKDFLPKAEEIEQTECYEPLPESLIWLILTGDLPSHEEYNNLTSELRERSKIEPEIIEFIKKLPKEMNPTTQLSNTLLYMQPKSRFAQAYRSGINKSIYWEYFYEDSMDIIAKLPVLAAYIYRHSYKNDDFIPPSDKLDWAGNFAHMLGLNTFEAREFMRGYMTIFHDNSGGNACSHASQIVSSALGDPYLAYSAGLNSVAGCAYNSYQAQSLEWLIDAEKNLGKMPKDEKIKDFIINETSDNRKIPGYSHDDLKHIDPKFLHQKAYGERYWKNNSLFYLVKRIYRVAPGVIRSIKKGKNIWPTADASTGALMNIIGIKEKDFFGTVFGVSRAIGVCSNLVLGRIYGLPIERPSSMTMEMIEKEGMRKKKQN